MRYHCSVEVDFDTNEPFLRAELYDSFRRFIEAEFTGVMTSCTPYIDDEEADD